MFNQAKTKETFAKENIKTKRQIHREKTAGSFQKLPAVIVNLEKI